MSAFGATAEFDFWVRTDPATLATGYNVDISPTGLGTNLITLGGPSGFLGSFTNTFAPGDTLVLGAVGTKIFVLYNGVEIISATDSSTASGLPVIAMAFAATQSDTSLSLFEAGEAFAVPVAFLVTMGLGLFPLGESSDLSGMVPITSLSVDLGSLPLGAELGPSLAPAVTHTSKPGTIVETFGGRLFEQIVVLPAAEVLGYVLTEKQFAIEVWNTFQNTDQVLESITIAGSGGLVIADPLGEPLLYAAQDSRIYQAEVPAAGDVTINQTATFGFLSGILGVSLAITGSRIALFSVAPDWNEGVAESIEYLTDVMKAYSDNEQRRGLRQFPRRALRFRAFALNAINAAGMESMVWGWQNQPFGIPWWPDASAMTANTPAGSFFIPCNTADRQFAPGGLCCIWQSEYVFEALSVVSVASGGVTVSSPTQLNWTASSATLVMPVFLARLPDKVEVRRFSSSIDQIDLEFIGEAQQAAPAPALALTQYKGIDVLEISPNWEAPLNRVYKRSMVTVDPKIGPITVVDKGGSAVVSQEFPWFLNGHSTVTTFRAFILLRFGQLNSFWIPTWDQDMVLAVSVGSERHEHRHQFGVLLAVFLSESGAPVHRFHSPGRQRKRLPENHGVSGQRQRHREPGPRFADRKSIHRSDDDGVLPHGSRASRILTSHRDRLDERRSGRGNLSLQELPRELPS